MPVLPSCKSAHPALMSATSRQFCNALIPHFPFLRSPCHPSHAALPVISVQAAYSSRLCFSQSRTSSDTQYATTHQVMITTDMRQATETLSKVNTVFNCRTDAPRLSRISPTGRMATARTSDTRAKLIIQPEAHWPPLLTTQHQAQVTMQVPIMQHTEDQTQVTHLTPTGMTAVMLLVVRHHLRTHLLDMANNPSLYQHHHSWPSHSFPYIHNSTVPFCFMWRDVHDQCNSCDTYKQLSTYACNIS